MCCSFRIRPCICKLLLQKLTAQHPNLEEEKTGLPSFNGVSWAPAANNKLVEVVQAENHMWTTTFKRGIVTPVVTVITCLKLFFVILNF
jgi:hypothetical protein